jgi:hypothetical protein
MGNYWKVGVDPGKDWKDGLGWALRVRWLIATGVAKGLGVSVVWKYAGTPIGIAATMVAVSAMAWLIELRFRRIKNLSTGKGLHSLCHSIRNDVYHLELLADQGKESEHSQRYSRFHVDVANRIANYFQKSVGDSTIGCAIRLAHQKRLEDPAQYVTVGRSQELDQNRKDQTEPVPFDTGIANMLRQKAHQGVWAIDDIEQAIKDGQWKRCKTDDFTDVRFLMIAPINTYKVNGERKHMLGILYVTSSQKMLKINQIEPIMAFADLLGMVYPLFTGIFQKADDKTASEVKIS